MSAVEIQTVQPSAQVYNQLRNAVGWHVLDEFRAKIALQNSLFCVCAFEKTNNTIIGMGRIVGDGTTYFYIQDVIVSPRYQSQGVGHQIVKSLMDWLSEHAPPQSGAFLGLMTEPALTGFYGHYGFETMGKAEPFMKIWRNGH